MSVIVEYVELSAAFDLAPEEALAYFNAKGLKTSFAWQDMLGEEHDVAFTVAKMMDTDLLATVQNKLSDAIANGSTLADFKRELIPTLQKAGWWGKHDVIDPLTGKVVNAQLGSASRLETIFRTNIQSAYSVGAWDAIDENRTDAPLLLYDAVDDNRTRPEHAAMDGTLLPVDHPWWRTHYPPNGWNCRCGVIQLTQAEAAQNGLSFKDPPKAPLKSWTNPRTGKTELVPSDLDPGWDHNPGMARVEQIKQTAALKTAALDAAQQAALSAAEAKQAAEHQQYLDELAAAQDELDKHATEKTAWLSAAIKQVQASKAAANLNPKEILELAKQKAAQKQATHYLFDYKKAVAAGTTPNAKAQAAFDALSPAEQKKVQAAINKATGEADALTKFKAIEQGYFDGTLDQFTNQAVQEVVSNSGANWASLPSATKIQLITEKANALAAKTTAKLYQVYPLGTPEYDVMTGVNYNLPSDVSDVDQALAYIKALGDWSKKQASDAAAAVAGKFARQAQAQTLPLSMRNMVKYADQEGSNAGGFFTDQTTGTKYYIKEPASADIAQNELLASKLYAAAGVEVPELTLWTENGVTRIASKIVDGVSKNRAALTSGFVAGAHDNFVVDAWLGNWDVVGLNYDNLLLNGGRAIRIDVGGSLRYRAQGGLKGAAWGDDVGELDSLLDPRTNAQSASVFGSVTQDQRLAGARKVLSVSDSQIERLVKEYGPSDSVEAEKLVQTLKARRAFIARKFPDAAPPEPVVAIPDETLSPDELKRVKAARQNGYSIKTDKGQIEDQQVLYAEAINEQGNRELRGWLKVRGQASRDLTKEIREQFAANTVSGQTPGIKLMYVKTKVLDAVKGIAQQAKLGDNFRQKDIDRLKDAIKSIDDAVKDLSSAKYALADAQGPLVTLREWKQDLTNMLVEAVSLDVAKPWPKQFSVASVPDFIRESAQALATSAGPKRTWSKFVEIKTGKITNGYQEDLANGTIQAHGGVTLKAERYRTQIGDAWVEYYPEDVKYYSQRGRMQIGTELSGEEGSAAILNAMRELGIDTARATADDAERMYLQKLGYVHKLDLKKIDSLSIDNARQYVAQEIRSVTGVDILGSAHYRPDGFRQAFEDGRVTYYRPELLGDAQWKDFEDNHRIHHGITDGNIVDSIRNILRSGGQMAPTVEKLRRGIQIGGMSPIPDLESGGAQYFFTRWKKNNTDLRSDYGIVWKARAGSRVDAISYSSDEYGRTVNYDGTEGFVQANRKVSISDFKDNARNGSNEVIFKESLSLFDDLDYIRVRTQTERQKLLQVFRDEKITVWPDGRPLEDVVKTQGQP